MIKPMFNINYRKFKKNTRLRAFASPSAVRGVKQVENVYRRMTRSVTTVKHRSKYNAICHIGLQKTGSVWFREMFADNCIFEYSGLEFVDCAGKGSEISIDTGIYSPIRKPFEVDYSNFDNDTMASVVVIRHPFSMLLSWIKSTKAYHISGSSDQGMDERRKKLNELTEYQQLMYAADFFEAGARFENFEKLLNLHSAEQNSMILKYEDCVFNAEETFASLFRWLDIGLPDDKLVTFVQKHSFQAYSGRPIDSATVNKKSAMQGASHVEIESYPDDIKNYVLDKIGAMFKDQYNLN